MGGSIVIRPLVPGDEIHCLDLYNYVYPVSMSGPYWQWRNEMGPAGRSFIETAWDRDRLVGFYGLVPQKLYMGGREVLGAFSDAAVTHPEYRYKGIFTSLGKSLYRRAKLSGVKIIYGFPTDHSRHGLQTRLGWDLIHRRRELIYRGRRGVSAGPASIEIVEPEGEDINSLWGKLSGSAAGAIMAVRDRHFLDWRFFRHPENRYRVCLGRGENGPGGVMAVRQTAEAGETYVDVVDIAAVDARFFRELAAYALRCFKDAGCIRVRIPAENTFFHLATGMGFRENGAWYYFGGRFLADRPAYPREWYYTMADAGDM